MPPRAVKTVIVTPQVPIAYPNGGIGTFADHFINLLVEAGHRVALIQTYPTGVPAKKWVPEYEKKGVDAKPLFPKGSFQAPVGFYPWTYASELVSAAIPRDADIVYYADWLGNGAVPVRQRRFDRSRQNQLVVNVLHGNSEWHRQGMHLWTSTFEEMILDFQERYAAKHSDYVVAPSQYMFGWAEKNSWELPPLERRRVLKYPFYPRQLHLDHQAPETYGEHYREIVFFGRLETRKGFELFVEALIDLQARDLLAHIEQITLMGTNGQHRFGPVEEAIRTLKQHLTCEVIGLTDRDTLEAQSYLAARAHDTLVVIPSLSETFGFTIIETSLIAGINVIFSNAGGIPEVLGEAGRDYMFEPYLAPFIRKLENWLERGPRTTMPEARYDWKQANAGWLGFHEEMMEIAHERRPAPQFPAVKPSVPDASCVDICIPFYNLGGYLEDALESLEKQTAQDFNVYIVDDGSTDTASKRIFAQMRQRYSQNPRWHFFEQANQGVCAARNFLVAQGSGEYVLFMDSDNIAHPTMVQRFVEGIALSCDDCLTSYMYVFKDGEELPLKSTGANVGLNPYYLYIPIGNYLAAGLVENSFGDLNCIMKRSAFEAVGGFTLDYPRYVNQEDRELLTRLSMHGFKLDVIPEFLFYYRYRETSRLRTTSHYLNESRILRNYEAILAKVGMEDIAPLILGLKYRTRELVPGSPAQPAQDPADPMEYLVNRVRWVDLVRALRRKFRKNWQALRGI
ncbi:MAG: glycosyltransferase [Chloroflexi bacterium]|nr:glycosyltransferase [Chloroflexota bacterium]